MKWISVDDRLPKPMVHVLVCMKNKNAALLRTFCDYCAAHPEERFWQALRNWSGHAMVLVQDVENGHLSEIRDTFYTDVQADAE